MTKTNGVSAHSRGGRLGTFAGVFKPSILTILGLVLFLRLEYVVGSSGLAKALGALDQDGADEETVAEKRAALEKARAATHRARHRARRVTAFKEAAEQHARDLGNGVEDTVKQDAGEDRTKGT
jgi:hypothetical protein